MNIEYLLRQLEQERDLIILKNEDQRDVLRDMSDMTIIATLGIIINAIKAARP